MPRPSSRERLLDAAAEVLIGDGAEALTLEAVAQRAGVSKGGLFYHFPTKQALVAAMVGRLTTAFDAALAVAGDRPGDFLRAYVEATIPPSVPESRTAAHAGKPPAQAHADQVPGEPHAGQVPGEPHAGQVPGEPHAGQVPAAAPADQVTAALLAAVIVDPAGLAPLRERFAAWQTRLTGDGIDPAVATTVRLAVDGWWAARLFGLGEPDPELHERTRRHLLEMIDRAAND
ncbi:TetR/AcrR family transcriptional regulator [Nonomuraea sp. NPDC003804]|uniref:TetR/AcrR family transcriptional regulator n=1 Tax=Nonomuraea sp. NPDC003804 TaxID=3154547 RepID=UPI0033ADEC7E